MGTSDFIGLMVNYSVAVAPLSVAYVIIKKITRAIFGAAMGRGFRL